jgi:P pilus assembly chaperone PapD
MKKALRTGWCLAILLGVVYVTQAAAQVSVAPTALFLTEQARFGGLYVTNNSTTPQEVTVNFRFGYPAADSTGSVVMLYQDTLVADPHSIAQYVRAFPQRFILPPGETQVVRLTAQPGGTATDGLYWTRVVTTSTPQVQFAADTATAGIQTRVQFRLQQVTALFYRRGALNVRVGLRDLNASYDSTKVVVAANIDHAGNTPFFGTARIRVLDSSGKVVSDEKQAIAVYVPERRRFAAALADVAPGNYVAELTLLAERSDLPQDELVKLEPVTARTEFSVKKGL